MVVVEKGIYKRKVNELNLTNHDVASIIINSLLDSGYDVTSEPLKNEYDTVYGEKVTIYKIEKRY